MDRYAQIGSRRCSRPISRQPQGRRPVPAAAGKAKPELVAELDDRLAAVHGDTRQATVKPDGFVAYDKIDEADREPRGAADRRTLADSVAKINAGARHGMTALA